MPERLPRLPFRLHTAPVQSEGFTVVKLRGVESISNPYTFDMLSLVEGKGGLTDLPAVGQAASLTVADSEMEEHAVPRVIHGVLSRVRLAGMAYDRDGTWLKLRLVPRLWTLKHRRTRRIFQDLTVQRIVEAVLADHGVANRWLLDVTPATIGYAVQYDETDFEFIQRMLARFGLFYFFDHGIWNPDSGATETMVICDRAIHYPPVARAHGTQPLLLKLADREGTFRLVESLLSFAYERRTKPTAARHADWDMRTPGVFRNNLVTTNVDPDLGTDKLLIEEFDHRNDNDRIRVTPQDPRTELEQHRSESVVGRGASDCHLFSPGHRFVMDNHEYAPLNAEWVISRVEHKGEIPEFTRARNGRGGPTDPAVYTNEFECTHAETPLRPPRPRRVLRQVSESAIVVGPEGEEIFVDLFGRIKIQFLWDRDRRGVGDDRSSCWVRVAQGWAGSGWGFQFIPRVGMEVVVTYMGDTDHPMVTGCVYNAVNNPTHMLPNEKSRSGIRTQSTPGGAGFNELAFEDSSGREEIAIHAQRDLNEVILNDASRGVGHDETRSVANDRTDYVGRNEVNSVHGQRTREVTGNDALTVGGDRFETVRGNRILGISADQTARIEGNRLDVVMGRMETEVTGDRTTTVSAHERGEFGSLTEAVHGEHMLGVNGSSAIRVGRHEAKRSFVLHVEGQTLLSSDGDTEITASESIALRCGTSWLRVTPTSIEMHADTVMLVGKKCAITLADEKVQTRADTAVITKTDKITLKSSGASLKLDDDAKLGGGKVKLGPPVSADVDSQDASSEPTTIKLADADGNSIPNQRYILVKDDGSEIAGVLDSDGQAVVILEGSAHVVFPDMPTAQAQ